MLVGNGHLAPFTLILFLFSLRWASTLYHVITLQIQNLFEQFVPVEMMWICIFGFLNVSSVLL